MRPNQGSNREPNRELNRNAIIDGTAHKAKDGKLCAAAPSDSYTQ